MRGLMGLYGKVNVRYVRWLLYPSKMTLEPISQDLCSDVHVKSLYLSDI